MPNSSPPTPADCVRRLKVLADQTRLGVVELLMEGPKHVGALNAVLQMDQSLLSHHLKVLRDEGIVEADRDGKAVLYRLSPEVATTGEGNAVNLGCCLLSF